MAVACRQIISRATTFDNREGRSNFAVEIVNQSKSTEMFASHFARAKADKREKPAFGKAENQEASLRRQDNESGQAAKEKKRPQGKQNDPHTSETSKKTKPRKRRRHEAKGPRRPRPTQEALDLSRQLQDLSRQKRLKEMTDLFWQEKNAPVRDNHHVCIIVDCCSKCGAIDTAEKVVRSLPADVRTVEVNTALLKCYGHSGQMVKAMQLFREMCKYENKYQRPNVRTLNTLLRGCLWTASTSIVVDGSVQIVVGGVVSSEEAWALYQNIHKDEEDAADTSSYEATIILLSQALRVKEAEARLEQLQSQYKIKCKGKASIKGGDQSSLETCGYAYLCIARAYALMGHDEGMWLSCQRCLHAIQSSKTKLENGDSTELLNQGGKRGWKVDNTSQDGQKRAASNLAYRRHRLDEFENEARALLKRRNSAETLSTEALVDRLQSKLLYFTGDNSAKTSSENGVGAAHSFGLTTLTSQAAGSSNSAKSPPLSSDGHLDLSKIFAPPRHKNPIDIEIGSGFGDWIVRQALAFSDRNHVAVELKADRVYQIFARGCLTGGKALENLCTIGGDSGTFLRDRVHQGTIASVFANHPEPPTQTLGQNMFDLEGIMSDATEPSHMLNSATLGWASEALAKGGRIVVVTDNRNYGNLVCATFVRLQSRKKGLLRSLDEEKARKMKLKKVEMFMNGVVLYEGIPSLQLGHARDDMLTGQSYFDRLWKTGAGSHAESTRRYIIAMYKQ